MYKMKKTIITIVSILILFSCAKEEIEPSKLSVNITGTWHATDYHMTSIEGCQEYEIVHVDRTLEIQEESKNVILVRVPGDQFTKIVLINNKGLTNISSNQYIYRDYELEINENRTVIIFKDIITVQGSECPTVIIGTFKKVD